MGDSVSASFASSFRKLCKPWQPASGGLICYAADVSPLRFKGGKATAATPYQAAMVTVRYSFW